jgi:hypothetical protein
MLLKLNWEELEPLLQHGVIGPEHQLNCDRRIVSSQFQDIESELQIMRSAPMAGGMFRR